MNDEYRRVRIFIIHYSSFITSSVADGNDGREGVSRPASWGAREKGPPLSRGGPFSRARGPGLAAHFSTTPSRRGPSTVSPFSMAFELYLILELPPPLVSKTTCPKPV